MKLRKILTAALLCAALLIPSVVGTSAAGTLADLPTLTGETSRTTEYLKTKDGQETGVRFTTINLSGHYGSKIAYVTEFSLANTHLSVDTINNGSYMVSRTTVASVAISYSKNGKTVLSALNGDLWMTAVHSNTSVTTKTLCVPRGIMIIDGEVWATEQIDQENLMATNIEKGTPSPAKSAFGVTKKNQPLVGSPVINVTIKNEENGRSLTADGLNRLPALDSMIVYNHRVNSSNYALGDSYEIELESDDPAFNFSDEVWATVKAIYPSYTTARPAIGANTIVITARGSRVKELIDFFETGDRVSFRTTITDRNGHTSQWKNVDDAIGGHMNLLYEGNAPIVLTGGEYPTSLIGYKDDGTVMFCAISSTKTKTYTGLKQSQALEFCRELGYRSVFYLDGGGSTTSVTLKEGSYIVRNNCSDGSPRAVINSVAVVWNDEPVCEKQGSLKYLGIEPPPEPEPDPTPVRLSDGTTVSAALVGMQNAKAVDASGKELSSDALIGSGCRIIEYKSDGVTVWNERAVIVAGDLNGDGRITSADALTALRYSAGLCELGETFALAADADDNGTVTSADALRILRYSAGLEASLK